MKIDEIRKLNNNELNQKIKETKEELFTKRMQHSMGNLEKPVELKNLRREIARMKTIQTERKIKGDNNEQ